MTYVIGIDPSLTSTGVAIISDNEPPKTLLIKPKTSWSYGTRLLTIFDFLSDEIQKIDESIEAIGIERGFSGGNGPVAQKLGAANGACWMAITCYAVNCEKYFYEVAPKSRTMYATGSGNADKESVLKAACEHFEYDGLSYDEADALAIAYFTAEVKLAKIPNWDWEPYGGWPELGEQSYLAVDSFCNKHPS